MSAPIPGDRFIRTLTHYLDSNEARLLNADHQSTDKKPNGKSDASSLAATVSSFLTGGVSSLSSVRSEAVIGSSQSARTSSKGTSIYGVQIPYMSLLAAASPSATALSTTPYMPLRSTLTLDVHHLYFLLVQFEHLGLEIGDPALLGDIPEGGVVETETSVDENKTPSILSVGSIASTMSSMSLSTGWNFWQRRQQASAEQRSSRPIHEDIVHIYKFFERVSALRLQMNLLIDPQNATTRSSQRAIVGYEKPLPQDGSIILSLQPFRNLSCLELSGVPPHMIDGWPELQQNLVSLVIKGASIEDAAEVVDGLVEKCLDRRNEGDGVRREWPQLKMLSLADNNLTTLDSRPLMRIRSVTHLNLSSNLLIDVPPALSTLYNLQSLNLSYNMISFVNGINMVLGNIQELDLRGNRLTVLVGLDRLWALERIDLRDNRIEDAAEIGRLTSLPNIEDIWVEGNPFTILKPDYRVDLFIQFKSCDIDIQLDGSRPTFAERLKVNAATAKDDYQPPAATVASEVASSRSSKSVWPTAQTVKDGETASDSKTAAAADQEPSPTGIVRTKSKKSKRFIRLGRSEEPPPPPLPENADDNTRKVHRVAELEEAVQHEALTRKASTGSRRRRSRSKPRRSKSSPTDEQSQKRSTSPASEKFRRKIESMRREAGTEWLRVLQEMDLGQTKTTTTTTTTATTDQNAS